MFRLRKKRVQQALRGRPAKQHGFPFFALPFYFSTIIVWKGEQVRGEGLVSDSAASGWPGAAALA